MSQAGANLTMIEEKLRRTWVQIGQALACKSSKVEFEPINEPPAEDAEDGANQETIIKDEQNNNCIMHESVEDSKDQRSEPSEEVSCEVSRVFVTRLLEQSLER